MAFASAPIDAGARNHIEDDFAIDVSSTKIRPESKLLAIKTKVFVKIYFIILVVFSIVVCVFDD